MANVISIVYGTYTGLGTTLSGSTSGVQSYVPRGLSNFEYCPDCPPSTGDPRPTYGQALPRWNKGGRQP